LDTQLLRLHFGIFALHTVLMAMFVVIPPLLIERGALQLSAHWMVYLPVVLLSFLLMWKPLVIAERRAMLRRLFLASIALVLIAQLGFLLRSDGLIWLALWLLVFFTGFNILEACLPSLVSRIAPASAKGLALGIYNTSQALGLFAGGALGGVVAARWGSGGVFVLAAIAMAIWLLVALGMREVAVAMEDDPSPDLGRITTEIIRSK
jgi:predicted MFS family arabinose efflux permease